MTAAFSPVGRADRVEGAGGLAHGGAAAALRGCWCEACRRRLVELSGEWPQLELPFAGEVAPLLSGSAPAAAPRVGVRLLPAGLVPVLPAGVDAMAASQARQDVLAGAADEAAGARRLVELGLATPAARGPR